MSTSFSEVLEFDFDQVVSSMEEGTSDTQSLSSYENSHCDDCKDDGCSETEDCCKSACSCSSTYLLTSGYDASSISSPFSSRIQWYFYSDYRLPFLDPALKPPLFS
ncbi:MAG: hypothetical protein KC478_08350 [Bacteriovoracaceae bacterium]|nr:hypothetical protein [Bacteriovoracaceae bacterium]